ncbi:hypothetical protein JTS93_06880 [Clostridium botulinum]|nr:hypothetical protein [Clostridium botulinum]
MSARYKVKSMMKKQSINKNQSKILDNSNIDILKNNKFKFIKEIQDKLYKKRIYFKTTYPGLIVAQDIAIY